MPDTAEKTKKIFKTEMLLVVPSTEICIKGSVPWNEMAAESKCIYGNITQKLLLLVGLKIDMILNINSHEPGPMRDLKQ